MSFNFKALDLTGKVAVVIGGTSGIGRAIALGLADAGADVVPTSRRTEMVEKAAAEIEAKGRRSLRVASDMFPRSAVGSVVGIGGMAGAVGGMLIAKIVGYVLEWTGSYLPVFIIAGSMYLIALLFIHLIVPRMEPASC